MAVSSPKGLKTLWEKEKLLVTSNFSFSHSVFRRLMMACVGGRWVVWERDNASLGCFILAFCQSIGHKK